MKIKVMAFGVAKDIFGASVVEVDMAAKSTVANLKAALEARYPRLQQLSSFMIAVNEEYAEAGNSLQPHDEVAIIPPVSGG
ncbi:molybdopterin converting factor subunit 1 [Pontibacter sp. CAU 1760]